MPAQSNATVTGVAGAGTRDDWDVAAVAGASKWAGEVRAYLRERIAREALGDTVNIVTRRSLIIDVADFDAMALDTDDVIAIAPDGRPAFTATAQAIAAPRLAGIPRPLQTARIELEDA